MGLAARVHCDLAIFCHCLPFRHKKLFFLPLLTFIHLYPPLLGWSGAHCRRRDGASNEGDNESGVAKAAEGEREPRAASGNRKRRIGHKRTQKTARRKQHKSFSLCSLSWHNRGQRTNGARWNNRGKRTNGARWNNRGKRTNGASSFAAKNGGGPGRSGAGAVVRQFGPKYDAPLRPGRVGVRAGFVYCSLWPHAVVRCIT